MHIYTKYINKTKYRIDKYTYVDREKINIINNKLRKQRNKFSNCQNSNGMIYAQILIIEDFRSFFGFVHSLLFITL